MAATPAIVVVLTAPSRRAECRDDRGQERFQQVETRAKTISSLLMISFRRGDKPHALLVGMIGVKLGDRFVQIGCAHGGRLAAIAAKVGLSGRAVAVVADAVSAARAAKGASEQGVLVEIETAPPTSLPLDDGRSIWRSSTTPAAVRRVATDDRAACPRTVAGAPRQPRRVMVIGAGPRRAWPRSRRRLERRPFDPDPH
jgi:hypothetical protein